MEYRHTTSGMSAHNPHRTMQGRQPNAHNQIAHAADNSILEHKSLAMAYVLWQKWQEVYPAEKALECGTLFPELNKPFMGRR